MLCQHFFHQITTPPCKLISPGVCTVIDYCGALPIIASVSLTRIPSLFACFYECVPCVYFIFSTCLYYQYLARCVFHVLLPVHNHLFQIKNIHSHPYYCTYNLDHKTIFVLLLFHTVFINIISNLNMYPCNCVY